MKKKLLVALAVSSLTSMANAGGFDGPFVQANIGGVSSSTNNTYTQNVPNIDSTVNGTSFVGQVLAGYSQSFNKFNLAGNVFYTIGNQNTESANVARANPGSNLNMSGTFKNTWGVAIEPGYNFDQQTLGYLKLAYVSTTLNGSAVYSEPGSPSESFSNNTTFSGIGYGLGFKRLLDKNVYVGADVMYTQYQSKTDSTQFTTKPNQLLYTIGLGYKF